MNTSTFTRRILPALVPLFTCLACASPEESPADAPPPEVTEQGTEQSIPTSITDAEALRSTAHRLAGLETGLGTPWDHHAQELSKVWKDIEERHLEPMSTWSVQTLHTLAPADAPLFYPFGGPDFSSAHRFFPQATSYILIGLEPPGTLPELNDFDPETLTAELERLRGGFDSMVEAGYFVAKHMEQEFVDAQRLDGMLPVLYISLAREGFVPIATRYITFDETGTVVYPQTVTPEAARAVEIEFIPEAESGGVEGAVQSAVKGGTAPRRLYYISQDLSNEGFQQTPSFERFMAAQAPFNVYMKSAMYFPHTEEFSRFDKLVSAHAQNLLQDDSGLPFHTLDPAEWTVRLFGEYTATLSNYQEWFQPDLRDAYTEADDQPVDFSIGYNSRISGSTLIWAERVNR